MHRFEVIRLMPDDTDWTQVLDLINKAFSFMDGVVNPPSSARQLTAETLKLKAGKELAFGIVDEGRVIACLFCHNKGDCLYLGKLAVATEHQGRGFGSHLVARAEIQARKMGISELECQVRVELTGNRAFFETLGFVKHAETSHEGFDRTTSITLRKWLD